MKEPRRTVSTDKIDASAKVLTLVTGVEYWMKKLKWATDGSNAITVTLYDSEDASGKVLAEYAIAGADTPGWVPFDDVPIDNGLYIALTGTGALAWVEYERRP